RQRTRTILGSTILVVALVGATVALVVWDSSSRVVPRDQVEPALLLQDHISPLTSYRVWKQNSHYTTPLFRVSGDDLPPRLRLAVVDSYDGIDFTISTEAEDGRFTRFPSANPTSEMSEVRVDIEEGYADIWVPLAPPLGQRLAFSGPRPLLLEDTFYLNPARGAGIVIGDGDGLKQGDSYTTLMSTTPAPELDAAPISEIPLLDAETHPELFTWLENNSFTPGAKGLTTAVEALRARGYLSHSLELGEETPRWLSQLQEDHEFTFFSSPGGHNTARIEHLFAELNEQDSLLPSDATDKQRIAAIGDDEQFATAAALVARALGYDSRIVIGVRLGDEGAG
ncbi:MAG TPA: hypothetical protein VK054_05095, partial [Beutenbergiaceae bacterium]|nr:hypothetical protein [Beutenbergiaceae bacterium]